MHVTTPISEEFTIAEVFDTPERVSTLTEAVADLGDGKVRVERGDIDSKIPETNPTTSVEAEALFVGLVLNDVARKVGRETPFVAGTFEVDVPRATTFLNEQAVVLSAREEMAVEEGVGSNVKLLATIPDQLDVQFRGDIDDLDTRVRSTLLTAADVVRVAMPYFDPQHPTVKSLRSLPRRGVRTRILTRTVEPGTDRYEVLRAMGQSLTREERELVEVAELFRRDSSGNQMYATHAKLLVADEVSCYIGSANFTVTNLRSNFEVGVMTSGHVVTLAAETFDAIFEESKRIDLPQ